MQNSKKKWAIIGGGMLGMTLAHRLSKENEVHLFEAGKNVGGLASAWKLDNIIWDKFYHVILLSDSYLRKILEEIGLEKELNWVETRTGFYTDGKLYSMSNSLEFLKFPPLNLIDKLRLGFTIFYASKVKDWKKLEQIPVEKWLRKLSGNNTFEKIWLPLLRAKLGETYSKTSAAFIWATIQRMYAARKSGLKKEMFGYVSGGYARILEKFNEVLIKESVSIKTDHAAKKIESKSDGKVTIEFQNGVVEEFDEVIITVPSPIAKNICPQLSEYEKEKIDGIQYLGVICASVLLKKPISNFYVTNITDANVPFTGIIEMSALVDKKNFNSNSLVYLPKYLTPDDEWFKLSDVEIEQKFLSKILEMYPQLKVTDILNFKIARAKYVFALST
ncbi:MAG: NAD(P)/FAD-dependent oxidoreductase, partial [Ignavibacteriaceae bacterium]